MKQLTPFLMYLMKTIIFPFSTPGYWFSSGGAENVNKLQKILELSSDNDFELYVTKMRKGFEDYKKTPYLTLKLMKVR